jgi:hypothetical protein
MIESVFTGGVKILKKKVFIAKAKQWRVLLDHF